MDVPTSTHTQPGPKLDSDRMRRLFRNMDHRAADANGRLDITVIGSARMELIDPGERPADTIDVVFDRAKLPSASLRNEIVGQMAIESRGQLHRGWMNDCASWLARPEAASPDPRSTTVYKGDALTVRAASAERMLVMKIDKLDDLTVTAARTDDPNRLQSIETRIGDDVTDVARLGDELGAHSVAEIATEYNRERGLPTDTPLSGRTTARLETMMPRGNPRDELDRWRAAPIAETDPVAELREIDISAEAPWRRRIGADTRSREGDYRFDDALRVNTIPDVSLPDDGDDIMFTDHTDGETPTNAEIDEMIRQAGRGAAGGRNERENDRMAAAAAHTGAGAAAGPYEPRDRETAPKRPSATAAHRATQPSRGRDGAADRGASPSRA